MRCCGLWHGRPSATMRRMTSARRWLPGRVRPGCARSVSWTTPDTGHPGLAPKGSLLASAIGADDPPVEFPGNRKLAQLVVDSDPLALAISRDDRILARGVQRQRVPLGYRRPACRHSARPCRAGVRVWR